MLIFAFKEFSKIRDKVSMRKFRENRLWSLILQNVTVIQQIYFYLSE